jgi:hypothetical protein
MFWNMHRIRRQTSRPGPFGVPEINYKAPLNGIRDRKVDYDQKYFDYSKRLVMPSNESSAWASEQATQFVMNSASANNIDYPPVTVLGCENLFRACLILME